LNFEELKRMYIKKKKKNKENYDFVRELFFEIKEKYQKDARKRGKNPNQSWNSWSGHNLQKLLTFIIKDFIGNFSENIGVTDDNELSRKKLSHELEKVRRNVEVFYDKYSVIPDADIIIYDKKNYSVKLIISCKASLRERVAQAAYWKLKLKANNVTKNIKLILVSTDNDKIFTYKDKNITKSRIIAEYELDGSYIFRDIEESKKVKNFNQLFDDIRNILKIK